MVLESDDRYDRGQLRVQRIDHKATAQSAATVFVASAQVGGGEANAEKVRARSDVSAVESAAVPVRRLYEQGQVSETSLNMQFVRKGDSMIGSNTLRVVI